MQQQPIPALAAADVERLFDGLSNATFFIKDAHGRYVQVNQSLVDRCGLSSKADLIGRLPSDVLGPLLGSGYEEQDRSVLQRGPDVREQLELHIYPSRKVGWCMTSKFALKDADGNIIGLTGISQDLPTPNIGHADMESLAAVVDHARDHLAEAPSIADLSRLSGLSPYQLDRRIRVIFGLSTGQWLLQQRIERARQLLGGCGENVAQIAMACGYADQSAFTRQFRRATGLTPTQYRRSVS